MKRTILILSTAITTLSHAATAPSDSARTISEAVVTGTRQAADIRHLPLNVSAISRKDIEERQETSVLPLLTEQIPGLFVSSRSIMGYGISSGAAGGITMRGVGGSPTTGMLMLVDSHPQYAGLMGHPVADVYQTMMAERIEVVRGPASVIYGSNAMGGVINIITRKGNKDGVRTNVKLGGGSYGTATFEGSNMVSKGKFSSFIAASYARTDGHRKDMDFEQYNGYAKLGYALTSEWNIAADLNLSHFYSDNPGSLSAPIADNHSSILRGATSISLDNRYSIASGSLNFYYDWGRHKIDDGHSEAAAPLEYQFNSKDAMLGVSFYETFNLFQGNHVTAGFDYTHLSGEGWNEFSDHDVSLTDRQADETALYAEMRQEIGKLFTLDAGIRYDHHSRTGTEWIPQAGISLTPAKGQIIKATVSKGFRNPTLRELYMFGSANDELSPERLINHEISYRLNTLRDKLTIGANIYYIKGDNIIQTVNRHNVNTGKIENTGFELEASYRLSNAWRLGANYSYLYMSHPVVAAPKNKLNALLRYAKGKWSAATSIEYVGGLYIAMSPEERESFAIWNLRGAYQLSKLINIYARGENLLSQSYEINKGYPMPRATVMGGISLTF